MGKETPIERADAKWWSLAEERFNAWRGRCLHTFTCVEASISQAVLRLHAAHPDTSLPHLAGQRVAVLTQAAGPGGFWPDPPLLAAIEDFQSKDGLRAALCHGRASVTINRAERWTAVLRLLVFRANKADHSLMVVVETEADALLADLVRKGGRVTQHLSNWHAAPAECRRPHAPTASPSTPARS